MVQPCLLFGRCVGPIGSKAAALQSEIGYSDGFVAGLLAFRGFCGEGETNVTVLDCTFDFIGRFSPSWR